MELFSFDDKPAQRKAVATKINTVKKPPVVKTVKPRPLPSLEPQPAPIVKKAKTKAAPAPRKHVRQTKVNRVVRLRSGVTTTMVFKREKKGIVVKARGLAPIVVSQRDPSVVPADKLYRAAIEHSSTNVSVFFGATEREAFKRAVAAWN